MSIQQEDVVYVGFNRHVVAAMVSSRNSNSQVNLQTAAVEAAAAAAS